MNDASTAPRRRFLARIAGARRRARCSPAASSLSQTEWFPEGAGRRRDAATHAAAHAGHGAQVDGAGIHRGRSARRRFAATAPREPDERRSIAALAANGFADYRLEVGGLVAQPAQLLARRVARAADRARRSRATIASKAGARSASGRARGSSALLDAVQPKPRGALSSCSTAPIRWRTTAPTCTTRASTWTTPTIAQTILAYELNDAPLPVANGAPLRLRVERQLGYKHAKYVMRIELVESFAQDRRRQGRLLGGPGLPVVRGDLTRPQRRWRFAAGATGLALPWGGRRPSHGLRCRKRVDRRAGRFFRGGQPTTPSEKPRACPTATQAPARGTALAPRQSSLSSCR